MRNIAFLPAPLLSKELCVISMRNIAFLPAPLDSDFFSELQGTLIDRQIGYCTSKVVLQRGKGRHCLR